MQIQVDTREHKKEWKRIAKHFQSAGADYFRSKLYVGDYCNVDSPRLVIDRKKDLLELIGNVTQQHERFKEELLRAQNKGFKLIILCEHGDGITELSDVIFWHNPRLDITEWVVENGHPVKKQLYPKATTGIQLYKSLKTIQEKYGVKFQFCNKNETGFKIIELLERGCNDGIPGMGKDAQKNHG